jgi:hypothetical protein
MDPVAQWQQARLAENARDRPEDTCCVEGTCYGWKPGPPGDEFAGETSHGRTEDELLAKLGG